MPTLSLIFWLTLLIKLFETIYAFPDQAKWSFNVPEVCKFSFFLINLICFLV